MKVHVKNISENKYQPGKKHKFIIKYVKVQYVVKVQGRANILKIFSYNFDNS